MNKDYSDNEMIDEENPPLSEEAINKAIPTKQFMSAVKKPTTIRLKASTLFYFQQMSQETKIPYQTLINMYLDDCAEKQFKLKTEWK